MPHDWAGLYGLQVAGADVLAAIAEYRRTRPQGRADMIVEHFHEHPAYELLMQIAMLPAPMLGIEAARAELSDIVKQLFVQDRVQRLQVLLDLQKEQGLTTEQKQQLNTLLRER